jgi:hypothetical protein
MLDKPQVRVYIDYMQHPLHRCHPPIFEDTTMNTTTNAFIYGATQSIGDTAITYALTAARWGVLGWDWYTTTFFSARATARYQLIGEIVGHCLILAVIGWRMAQGWAAAEVEGAIAAPVAEVDPFCPEVNPLPVVAVVEDVATVPTIRQLKAQAKVAKVKGYGRMTKPQLIKALKAA